MGPSRYDHRKTLKLVIFIEYGLRFEEKQMNCSFGLKQGKYGQVERPISTGQLKALQPLHILPINVVIYHGSSGRTHLVVGFSLICFQRLSFPDLATERCHWRDNSYTRGQCFPVLSY